MARGFVFFSTLLLLSACGDDRRRGPSGTDAGTSPDASRADSGGRDGGRTDGGGTDGGPDAGPDAGAIDAGPTPDAGPPDPCATWAPEYVETWRGTDNQQVLAATVDSTGALIMTGRNQGSVDFGDGAFDAAGYHDVFVTKLLPDGSIDWSVHMRDAGDDSEPQGIAVDEDDNVLVTGYVKGTIDFGGGPVGSGGSREIFVLKLAADGSFVWAKRYGSGTGWGIASGASGSVVVTGQASLTNDFGGGPQTASGQGDVFVLRLAADGSYVRSTLFGGPQLDVAYGVDVDGSGAVVVTGQSYGAIDFGTGPRGTAGTNYLFVAKIDASDGHVFSIVEAGGSAAGYVAAFAPDGSILVQGDGRGTVDLGGGPLSDFVAKLDASGAHLWSEATSNAALPRSMGLDGRGGVWIAGAVDPTRAGCPALPSGRYAFLTRLSLADGSFTGAVSGTNGSIWSAGVAPDGDVLAAGWIAGSGVDLGTGPLAATDSNDAVAVRYAP